MKKLILTLVVILLVSPFLQAQETEPKQTKTEFAFGADLVSRYIWRGMYLGGASVQPSLEFSRSNFFVGAWASSSINAVQGIQETDWYVGYNITDKIALTITDYYVFDENTFAENMADYKQETTSHTITADVSVTVSERLPLTILVSSVVYGLDALKTNGDINYSTYLELSYETSLQETTLKPYIGTAINTPGDDIAGFYGNTKPAVVHIGLRADSEIKITDTFSLPVFTDLILNPDQSNFFLVFGISL